MWIVPLLVGLGSFAATFALVTQRKHKPNPLQLRLGSYYIPSLHGIGPGLPSEVQAMIARYQSLERRIEAEYVAGRSPVALEEKAAALLSRIEFIIDALESEGEEATAPPSEIVTRAFADAYEATMRDFYLREDLEEFLSRGGPKWVPPTPTITQKGERVMSEGSWEVPQLVYRLRGVVGDPNADAFALIDAARDAHLWHMRLVDRLRVARRAGSGRDPVAEARGFLRKHQARKHGGNA